MTSFGSGRHARSAAETLRAPAGAGLRTTALLTVLAAFLVLAAAPPAGAFDAARERDNRAKERERDSIHQTPEYQERLRAQSSQNTEQAARTQATDPERNFTANFCWQYGQTCAGDVRLYDWGPRGYGVVQPVLFTARSGATLSGRVWATRSGPARRPGIVITNGSIQAPETLYWFAAQTLAKAGYVVLTFDPQGQGQSDTFGAPPDQDEGAPAQTDGRPFFDGTVDALDFFLSTPQEPFRPRPSCQTGTSHASKHERRVQAGLNAAHNPFAEMVDRSRIGIAGHSFGAAGVSYVGQADPRVRAIVAWDNLRRPEPSGSGPTRVLPCPSDPGARREVPITKPALGMSADYFAGEPRNSDPDPQERNEASRAYTRAGVDTGQINIRGGTHFEFSFLPDPNFGATLRGIDLAAWYTTAWFDKYVKGDRSADSRVITNRWLNDRPSAEIDRRNDPNMYSFYYRSRLDVRLAGGSRFRCEDMRRPDCGLPADCEPVPFWYVRVVTTADRPRTTRSCPVGAAGRRPALRLAPSPRTARTGRRTSFRFTATSSGRPVAGATVTFAGRRARTDARGRATIAYRPRRTGNRLARASARGMTGASTTVRFTRRTRVSLTG